jgi:phenylacetyl-CoA:acceptor oxidoreductase subunit 2
MSYGPNPWHQSNWDWRAALNFIGGGAGSGLVACAALAGAPVQAFACGAVLVALGLLAVWLEIGRPWRAINVLKNPFTSWMSREAWVAPLVLGGAVASAAGVPLGPVVALPALAYLYCQARILNAARGIPAWREATTVPLVVATGLAEGAGLLLFATALHGGAPASELAWTGFVLALFARYALWQAWRRRIRPAARALVAIDAAGRWFKAATLLPLAAALVALLAPPPGGPALLALHVAAGLVAAAGGVWFKFTLVTRGAYNQGFAITHLPVRGVRRRG